MEALQYLQAGKLRALCAELGMPAEATSLLCGHVQALEAEASQLDELLPALLDKSRAEEAGKRIQEICRPISPDGLAELAVLLAAAIAARPLYAERGISDDIFLATMGCFPRFVRESRIWRGHWCFDRGFWVWRQLCGILFRLGTLEFEICPLPQEYAAPLGLVANELTISIHIPSDAKLTEEELHASYLARDAFFMQHYGTVPPAYCSSWLLSPTVHTMLPPSSGIHTFVRDFTIVQADPTNNSGRLWIFYTTKDKPDEALPEQTSLQRAAKELLLAGGFIGSGLGKLNV